MSKSVLIIVSLFMLTSISYADVYLWEDKNEKVYTTNNIENVPEEYRDMVEVYKEGVENSADEVSPDEKSDSTADKDFRNMSAEEKINASKSMYSLGKALKALKAKAKQE